MSFAERLGPRALRSFAALGGVFAFGGCADWSAPQTYAAKGATPAEATPCAATPDELAATAPAAGATCAPSFASGVNVAWFSFAADIPGPNLCAFRSLFTNVAGAGGHVVRWWLHTDGSVTPGYDANGFALPLSDADIADIRSVLDVAQASHAMLTLSLWSFDMLKQGPVVNNRLLLTDDDHRQAYIDNVLTPLASALAGNPALYAWEAFNEPEGMTPDFGWTPEDTRVGFPDLQRTVNWFGDAIHAADSNARFTNGCWSFPACSNAEGFHDYYSDSELVAAGGRTRGTLDFYGVHYYASNGAKASPLLHPAAYWGLDKPIVLGEFYAADTDGVAQNDLFTHLFADGYAGAWAWQYANSDGNVNGMNGGHQWPAMQQGLENLRDAEPASVALACQ